MYVLGHFGVGLGLAWLLSSKAGRSIDYRLVLLGAILPDLIDKPLGLALGLTTRLWAHTLIFLITVLAVSAIPSVRGLLSVAFGVATHLLADRIWDQPWILFWPALGPFPADDVDLLSILHILITDPIILGGEIVGSVILVAFARAHGIRSWSALRAFLRNGTVPAAAGA